MRSRVRQLEDYDKILRQKIIGLSEDGKVHRLKWREVKTIRIHPKKQVSSVRPPSSYSLVLEIPVEDAGLLFLNSLLLPQHTPFPSFVKTMNIFRMDELPWQKNFRIDPTVTKIPFTDRALVYSYGPERIRFCSKIFHSLADVLLMSISPPWRFCRYSGTPDRQGLEGTSAVVIAPRYVFFLSPL